MARNLQSVPLLEADPELGADLSAARFERARGAITVSVMRLLPGPWLPPGAAAAGRHRLGVLVLEGTLLREVVIAGRAGAEVLGQGDLIRPYGHLGMGAPVPSQVGWRVLTVTSLATIDRQVLIASAPFPEVLAALASRAVIRAQTLGIVLAIGHIHGIKLRLLVLLWHLADRHGRVREDAVELPLPLTHRALSRIVGASRPTVSTAMRELEEESQIAKLAGGGFALLGEPPETDRAHAVAHLPARTTCAASRPSRTA